MSSGFTFRPAERKDTPLIIGIAGPTKSGKTMSSLILAAGLTDDRSKIAMLNAEGKRGEQYAEWFEKKYGTRYLNCNIDAPYSPERYEEALQAMKALRPSVGIIDSCSHMHDGPGGLLEYHDAELDRIAGKTDYAKRDRCNFTAWIKPKAAENSFIYTMLGMECPIILCFRAKEKLKIIPGKPPVDLGWQPIAGDRITFETIFTLVLPPHSKGVPDLDLSEMRTPFDTMVPKGRPIDEELGRALAQWAKGGAMSPAAQMREQVSREAAAIAATATQESQHGIDPADIPMCDLCQIKLVWRPGKKAGDEPFLACVGWEKHKDIIVKIPLSILKKNIEAKRAEAI